jgi:hypothetical protein
MQPSCQDCHLWLGFLAMTASTRAKRGAAYASNRRATSSSSLMCSSLASAFVAEVVARSADSWQCRLLALSANTLSCVAAWHCLLALSASAFSCAAARHQSLASSVNAFSCVAAQRCSLASSANAFSHAAALWHFLARDNSANAAARVAALWRRCLLAREDSAVITVCIAVSW